MKTKRRSTKKRTTRKGGGWPFFKSSNKFKEYYDLTNKLKKKWLRRKEEYNDEYEQYIVLDSDEDNITILCDNLINLTSKYMNQNDTSYNINEIKNMYDTINILLQRLVRIYEFLLSNLRGYEYDIIKGERWQEIPKDEYNKLLNGVKSVIGYTVDNIQSLLYSEYTNKKQDYLYDGIEDNFNNFYEYYNNLKKTYKDLFKQVSSSSIEMSGIGSSII